MPNCITRCVNAIGSICRVKINSLSASWLRKEPANSGSHPFSDLTQWWREKGKKKSINRNKLKTEKRTLLVISLPSQWIYDSWSGGNVYSSKLWWIICYARVVLDISWFQIKIYLAPNLFYLMFRSFKSYLSWFYSISFVLFSLLVCFIVHVPYFINQSNTTTFAGIDLMKSWTFINPSVKLVWIHFYIDPLVRYNFSSIIYNLNLNSSNLM